MENDFNDTNGSHKALSLGHTFANYFERGSKMQHGEAVFYGILLAALLASQLGEISDVRKEDILKTARLFAPHMSKLSKTQSRLDPEDVIRKIGFDKINHGNGYTFVLPTESSYSIRREIQASDIQAVISKFKALRFE